MVFLTQNAIEYTIRHIFKVAAPGQLITLGFEKMTSSFPIIVFIGDKKIKFSISSQKYIEDLLQGHTNLKQIFTADDNFKIPVILDEELPFAEIINNELIVNADIISLSFIMLSRYEETIITERDEVGNFEYKNSISYKYNFIDFPIVDEYAMILHKYLKQLFPNIEFEKGKYEVIPTHDIDEIYRYSFSPRGIRRIIGDIILNKDIASIYRSIKNIFLTLQNKKNDPFFKSIKSLYDLSLKLNLRSEFYFMSAKKNKYNSGYTLNDPLIKELINNISNSNMIVGLHGGYGTINNASLLKLEKDTLQSFCNKTILSVRQHYLHFDIHKTYKVHEEAGLEFDSTLGYNEQEGFRCGTCHEFQSWDFLNDCEMKLIERPLIIMDQTLWSEKKYSKSEALNTILKLHSRCEAVGGKFIILWHNAYVERKTGWFNEVYVRSLETICKYN